LTGEKPPVLPAGQRGDSLQPSGDGYQYNIYRQTIHHPADVEDDARMKTISTQKTFWLTVSALLTIGIVLLSIFSLKNGFYEIYPYFYLIPVILLAYFFPRTSVYFTILLGWVYLVLVYLYGPADIRVRLGF
jgi:hypothetical protein